MCPKNTPTLVVPHAEAWLRSGRVNKMGANDGDGGKIDIDGRKSDLQKRTPLFMAESIRLPGLPYLYIRIIKTSYISHSVPPDF